MQGPPSMSVVIPVLNEEDGIGDILTAAISVLEERGGEWEVIVVDNSSTDHTLERAARFVDGERVRVLRNSTNRGKGYSIRRGMLDASGDLRLMCDADCVASLSSLSRMEQEAKEAHVVVGSRLSAGAEIERHQAVRRRILGAGFITLSRLVMGKLPRDIYCGFKLWQAGCAQEVFSQARLDGWVFDAEALAIARDLGYTVSEIGIEWSNRPDSRLTIRNTVVPVVGELWTARRSVRQAVAACRDQQIHTHAASQTEIAS